MKENKINPEESMALITAIIDHAKNKLADDGFLLIFWGWLVFVSSVVNYTANLLSYERGYLIWLLMPIGAIVSIIYGLRQKKKEKVRTYLDSYMGYLWGAFIISLTITLLVANVNGIKTTYFFLMILYGVATFIFGGLLNFKPLVYGGLFAFLMALLSVYFTEDQQYLFIAAAIFCSYIVPGHLIRYKYKSQVNV